MKTLPEIHVPCENCGFATAINKRTTDAIAKELMGCLPEKIGVPKINGEEMLVGTGVARGYNQAVSEVRARLTAFIGEAQK